MAITNKEQGVWDVDQVYNKEMAGYWSYDGSKPLWAWGRGTSGQLGLSSVVDRSSPCLVGSNAGFIGVNGGPYIAFGTKSNGTLWVWGTNGFGQLGQNNTTASSSPIQLGTDTNWASAAAYKSEAGAIAGKTDGTLWTWGWNQDYGNLGQNNKTDYSSPMQVGTDTTWATAYGNYYGQGHNAMATKTDGTLWAWGYNGQGSLGHGNTTNRSSPTQVGTATNWSIVAKNYGHSNAVINEDGELWVVGSGGYGNLGQNNTSPSNTLVQLPGTTWKDCTGIDDGMVGTKTDGTLWAWGKNTNGSLGQNNTTNYSSPRQVPGTTWDRVISGYSVVIGSKTDGTLWSWGFGNYGSLGQNQSGPSARVSSPTQIGTDTDWVSNVSSMSGMMYTAYGLKLF